MLIKITKESYFPYRSTIGILLSNDHVDCVPSSIKIGIINYDPSSYNRTCRMKYEGLQSLVFQFTWIGSNEPK